MWCCRRSRVLKLLMIIVVAFITSLASTTVEPQLYKWICTGPLSELTYESCSRSGESNGCYHLKHFEQYRPCQLICNGILVHSVNEMKCKGYCPDYLDSSCTQELDIDEVLTSSTAKPATERKEDENQRDKPTNTEPSSEDDDSVQGISTAAIVALAIGIPLILAIIIASIVVVIKYGKCEHMTKLREKIHNWRQGAQPQCNGEDVPMSPTPAPNTAVIDGARPIEEQGQVGMQELHQEQIIPLMSVQENGTANHHEVEAVREEHPVLEEGRREADVVPEQEEFPDRGLQ